ncbi:MAG: [acyl-carrier-protein] S-malonyltransferase [Hyphomicrobiales bacterium]|nr:MAG: [acyl-carrier-protein] S-malonyltransferase [Hyphomicrobiales bacterium]
MTIAFTFPGQGSQKVGMGQALASSSNIAREVYEEVNEALGFNLSELMFNGPEDQLTLTENAQPALMAVSIAVMRMLEAQGVDLGKSAKYIAGHSLGEYSALTAAGVFSLADTAKLLQIRGRAMQKACPVGQGAMAALLGLDFAAAIEVAIEAAGDDVCQAANDNANGQVVISGHKAAVERALDIAKAKGAKRAILLPVSAPFHCSLMQPAAEAMQAALADVNMNAPIVPLIANVSASPTSDVETIRKQLVEQVTGTVRWRESVSFMGQNGIKTLVEVGNGKVLTGMVRRIDKELTGTACGTDEEIAAIVELLK